VHIGEDGGEVQGTYGHMDRRVVLEVKGEQPIWSITLTFYVQPGKVEMAALEIRRA